MALKAQVSTRRPGSPDRRNLLEQLENRQLMAGYAANFNFQPGGPATPAGYTPDFGRSFGWQFGKQSGWNANNSGQVVETRTGADNLHDTYAKIGAAGGASRWEVAVPNGTYNVKIVAGDANAYNARYAFKVEGNTVLDKTPTSGNRWVEGSASVVVKDGRLTLEGASSAYNNKINSISIQQTSTSTGGKVTGASVDDGASDTLRPPTGVEAWAKLGQSASLDWDYLSVDGEDGFIVEQSTDGSNFSEIARLPADSNYIFLADLDGGATYSWRVKSFNGSGKSAASDVVSLKIGGSASGNNSNNTPAPSPGIDAPKSPSSLKVSAKLGSSASLDWSGVDNEAGYIVEQSTDGLELQRGRPGLGQRQLLLHGRPRRGPEVLLAGPSLQRGRQLVAEQRRLADRWRHEQQQQQHAGPGEAQHAQHAVEAGVVERRHHKPVCPVGPVGKHERGAEQLP